MQMLLLTEEGRERGRTTLGAVTSQIFGVWRKVKFVVVASFFSRVGGKVYVTSFFLCARNGCAPFCPSGFHALTKSELPSFRKKETSRRALLICQERKAGHD